MHEAELLCATPGRLRLRWQALGGGETTRNVLAAIGDLPGVAEVDVSTPRRRLLVRFDPALTSLTRLLEILAGLGALDPQPAGPTAARDGALDRRAAGDSQLLPARPPAPAFEVLSLAPGPSARASADSGAVPRSVL